MGLPHFLTERLSLRRFRPEDQEGMAVLFGDPEVMRYSAVGTFDRTQVRQWYERAEQRHEQFGHGFLAVEERATGRYLGHAGLLAQELEGEHHVELAYWLRRDAWQQGFATEAMKPLREHGFEGLGCDQLVAFIHRDNDRSMRVSERLGLRRDREAVWNTLPIWVYVIGRDAHPIA